MPRNSGVSNVRRATSNSDSEGMAETIERMFDFGQADLGLSEV